MLRKPTMNGTYADENIAPTGAARRDEATLSSSASMLMSGSEAKRAASSVAGLSSRMPIRSVAMSTQVGLAKKTAMSSSLTNENAETIAHRTRAATRRHALGDVSNVNANKMNDDEKKPTVTITLPANPNPSVRAPLAPFQALHKIPMPRSMAPPQIPTAAGHVSSHQMEMTLLEPVVEDVLPAPQKPHVYVASQASIAAAAPPVSKLPATSASTGASVSYSQERVDWEDLDAEDAGDPSMVSEYVNDIFLYLRHLELTTMPDVNYMRHQTELSWKMRSVLVDWMVEIHWKLKLLPETLFLSVNLMDRFLSLRTVSLAKFQLVGVASTLIASKYEEVLSPSISNFVYLSDGSYDDQEVLKAEAYMLTTLNFNLSYPSPYCFLRRIAKADGYDIQTRTLSKYFLETTLLDAAFLAYPPSMLAAASTLLARQMLGKGDWSPAQVRYGGGYTAQALLPAVKALLGLLGAPLRYESVYKKYTSKKFMKASIFVKEYMAKYYPNGFDVAANAPKMTVGQ